MGHVTAFDHVGITVSDLERATDFFVRIGLEVDQRTDVAGKFIDTVTGITVALAQRLG